MPRHGRSPSAAAGPGASAAAAVPSPRPSGCAQTHCRKGPQALTKGRNRPENCAAVLGCSDFALPQGGVVACFDEIFSAFRIKWLYLRDLYAPHMREPKTCTEMATEKPTLPAPEEQVSPAAEDAQANPAVTVRVPEPEMPAAGPAAEASAAAEEPVAEVADAPRNPP